MVNKTAINYIFSTTATRWHVWWSIGCSAPLLYSRSVTAAFRRDYRARGARSNDEKL